MEEGNKKKKWPWVVLGICIGLGICFMLLVIGLLVVVFSDDEDEYYDDEYYEDDEFYMDDGYGNEYPDQESGYGGSQESRDLDLEAPGAGPEFGGEDSWDMYGVGDDRDYDTDSFDSWFDDGESWNWGGSYYESSSGVFSEDDYPCGLAVKPEGNVILYSMFVNYDGCAWDFNDPDDLENEAYVEHELSLAADYLEKEASAYGKELNVIYDWGEDPDLCCAFTVSGDLTDDYGDYYSTMYEYIDEYLAEKVKALEDKYGAESVVFMAYLNSSFDLQQTSCTFPKWPNSGSGMYEICFMHTRSYDEYESAAGYAHEICHTFGAPDLYQEDSDGSNFGISRDYVHYNEETGSNELMYTTYNCRTGATEYDVISNDITDITAYYLGWTDYSETVDEWGFEEAEDKDY